MAKNKATYQTGSGVKNASPKKQIVKQDMIDFIKAQGMTKALKRAGSISATGKKGEAEFLEGVRRMYGAKRLTAATKMAAPKATTSSYQTGSAKNNKSSYQTGSGVKNSGTKPAAKKTSNGMSGATKAKLIAGGAGLALLATKATPAGRALSGVVGAGRAIAGAAGRSKTGTKALATSGRITAKAKRPVSQSQYDAMKKVASTPKKFDKTKAAITGGTAASMLPKSKKK